MLGSRRHCCTGSSHAGLRASCSTSCGRLQYLSHGKGFCPKRAHGSSRHSSSSLTLRSQLCQSVTEGSSAHAVPDAGATKKQPSASLQPPSPPAAPAAPEAAAPATSAAPTASVAPTAAAVAATGPQRWELVRSQPLAGGTLEVVYWEPGRHIRVWLPPGYSPIDAVRVPYPVCYLNDGQNLFGDEQTLSGCSWRVAQTAAELISSGRLPPFIVVGIDHAGALRSLEYTPVKPGTGPRGFRSDAADWPGGGVSAYLERLKTEIVPWVSGQYAASSDPADMAFGGSSFGGIAALVAAMQGDLFGSVLVESPSLWIGEESFLQYVLAYKGTWPDRVYIGMGGREFSGTRGYGRENDSHFIQYMKALYTNLTRQHGLGPDRLSWVIDDEAGHTEAAWAARLGAALQFVGGGWWRRWHQRYSSELFFTIPRRLKSGAAGQRLFFNRQNSHTLSVLAQSAGLKMVVGRNSWQQSTKISMVLASQMQQPHLHAPHHVQQEVWQQWQEEYQQLLDKEKQKQLAEQQRQQHELKELQQRQQHELEEQHRTQWQLHDSNAGSSDPEQHEQRSQHLQQQHAQQTQQLQQQHTQQMQQLQQQHAQQMQHLQQHQEQHKMDPALEAILGRPLANCSIAGFGGEWWVAQLPPLPADCYELNAVFCDEAGQVYDNNDNNDFYIPVRQPWQQLDGDTEADTEQDTGRSSAAGRGLGTVAAAATLAAPAPTAVLPAAAGDACGFFPDIAAVASTLADAAAAARRPADETAEVAVWTGQLMFSMPPLPTAGAPMVLYCNKRRLTGDVPHGHNLRLHIGFNGWQLGTHTVDLKPMGLLSNEGMDLWCGQVEVPYEAIMANFVFSSDCNGTQCWDNNWGNDYRIPVRSLASAAAAASMEASIAAAAASTVPTAQVPSPSATIHGNGKSTRSKNSSNSGSNSRQQSPATPKGFTVREVDSIQAVPHAGGTLEVVDLKKRAAGGKRGKQRWSDERTLRVWTPPGFSSEDAPPGGWPALFLLDGKNVYEDWLAHQGVSWLLGHTAAGLISEGSIPGCVCIAIDSAGPYRSYNYLPFPPGVGQGGFRSDAARWPGGGADDFLMRVVHEIMPLMQQRYNLSHSPSRLAFGGASFGGVTALMAAMKLPHVFGSILVESPSLWSSEGEFLQDLAKYSGRLPERLYLGCGTREYSGTRDHERTDLDNYLLHQYHEAARLLQEKGLRGPQRFKFVVEQGAGHHEGAWRWRLGPALQYLTQGWWDS